MGSRRHTGVGRGVMTVAATLPEAGTSIAARPRTRSQASRWDTTLRTVIRTTTPFVNAQPSLKHLGVLEGRNFPEALALYPPPGGQEPPM